MGGRLSKRKRLRIKSSSFLLVIREIVNIKQNENKE